MHRIHMEENTKNSCEPQQRLNPAMKDVLELRCWNYWMHISFTPFLIVHELVQFTLCQRSLESW